MSGRKAVSAAFSKLFRRGAKSTNVQRGALIRGGPSNRLDRSTHQTTPRLLSETRNTLATRAQKQTKAWQNEVSRLRRPGEWREPRFLQTYDNKHDVKDWVMSRLWLERAFLPGLLQGVPPGSHGSTFVNENGHIFGPGRVGNKGEVWVWKPQSPMNSPVYHLSMLCKLKKTQAAYNNQGFGFHVTTDVKPYVPPCGTISTDMATGWAQHATAET